MPPRPSNDNGLPPPRSGQGPHPNVSSSHRQLQTPLVIQTPRRDSQRTQSSQPAQQLSDPTQSQEGVAPLTAQHVSHFDYPSPPHRPTSSLAKTQASPTRTQGHNAIELSDSPPPTRDTHSYTLQAWFGAPERHERIALGLSQNLTTVESTNQSRQETANGGHKDRNKEKDIQ